METTLTTLKDEKTGCFIDQNCTLTVDGKSFTSGGGFLGLDKNGKMGGLLYGNWKNHTSYSDISNWDGSVKIPAYYYGHHTGNMGDERCYVRFTYNGKRFFGRWCGIGMNQCINVREVK